MATLELEGFAGLEDAFRRIADLPWSVTEEALGQMAAVAAAEIRSTGESMGVRDPESDGYADITFSGSRLRHGTRTRNAEIAFINEYGKRGQKARPFIGTAMTQNEDKINAPAETVIGDWIESNFD